MVLGSQGGLRLEPFGYFFSVGDVDLNAAVDLNAYAGRKRLLRADTNDAYESAQQHWVAAWPRRAAAAHRRTGAEHHADLGGHLSFRAPGREVTVDEARADQFDRADLVETPFPLQEDCHV